MGDFLLIKIRDQGMELRVFVSRLEICPRGVAPEIKVLFCVFYKWRFL